MNNATGNMYDTFLEMILLSGDGGGLRLIIIDVSFPKHVASIYYK